MVPWAHQSPQPERNLDRFSHFCRAHNRGIQTDRQTDRPHYSVCNNRQHLHNVLLWCGLSTACMVVQAVVKANSQSNGNVQISNPRAQKPLNRFRWNLEYIIMSGVWPYMQIYMVLRQRGWSWRTCCGFLVYLFSYFILQLAPSPHQWTNLDNLYATWCVFRAKKVVWSPPPHIPHISSPNQCLLFATHAPYHRNLFCCSINTISSIPSISLNSLLGSLSFTLTLHIHSHLCSLKCHLIFFPDRLGLTSM